MKESKMENEAPIYTQIDAILATKGHFLKNGQVASPQTQYRIRMDIRKAFKDLHGLGLRIENLDNLGGKHISTLVRHWHATGKANSAMHNQLSRLRTLARWIGKPGLVKDVPHYLAGITDPVALKAKLNAGKDKGRTASGIDIAEKVREAERMDEKFGLMLMMQFAFGLIREEVIKNRPWKADHGDALYVFPGDGKNRRPRVIPISTRRQRAILDYVKSRTPKTKALGWELTRKGKPATLKQNLDRYSNNMKAIGLTKAIAGVTGHELRAQFAENLALLEHVIPPTFGDYQRHASDGDLLSGRMAVSKAIGNIEISTTGTSCGKVGRQECMPAGASRAAIIAAGLKLLDPDELRNAIPIERRDSVATIMFALSDLGIELTALQAHALWRAHSKRNAQAWSEPTDYVLDGITTAAWQLAQDAEYSGHAQQNLPLDDETGNSA